MVRRYAVRQKMEGKVGIHRPYAIVVLRRWTLLRHRFDHRRNRHVTTGRSLPVPAADVDGIAANVVLIVFRPLPCGANSDWPETRSPLSSPPSWPPLPARPTGTLPDAEWPPTTAVTAIASWLLGRILAVRRRRPSWQLRRATICRSWPSAGLEVPPIAWTCSAFHQRRRATFGLDSGHYHPPLFPPTCSSPPTPLSLTFTVVCRSTITNFLSGQPLVLGCELLGPARTQSRSDRSVWSVQLIQTKPNCFSAPFLIIFGRIEVYFLILVSYIQAYYWHSCDMFIYIFYLQSSIPYWLIIYWIHWFGFVISNLNFENSCKLLMTCWALFNA